MDFRIFYEKDFWQSMSLEEDKQKIPHKNDSVVALNFDFLTKLHKNAEIKELKTVSISFLEFGIFMDLCPS